MARFEGGDLGFGNLSILENPKLVTYQSVPNGILGLFKAFLAENFLDASVVPQKFRKKVNFAQKWVTFQIFRSFLRPLPKIVLKMPFFFNFSKNGAFGAVTLQ